MANDTVYLQDMLEHIQLLEKFLQGVDKDVFFSEMEKQFAAARALEIIGEASSKLSEDFLSKHPEIAGFRDKAIHDYLDITIDRVWEAATDDVAELKRELLK